MNIYKIMLLSLLVDTKHVVALTINYKYIQLSVNKGDGTSVGQYVIVMDK